MSQSRAAALLQLFDETTALFQRLRAVAAEVHGQGDGSAGRRGILRSLDGPGAQTVPQLSRERGVSRQHVQVLVNGLLREGLIARDENPAHRRSPLLRLTPEGRRQLTNMRQREADLLADVRLAMKPGDLEQAAAALLTVRSYLESADWRKHVAEYDRKTRTGRARLPQ